MAGSNENWHTRWEGSLQVSYWVEHTNVIWSTIMFLRIYPKQWKTDVYAKSYTQMFISTLFIIVKTWKPKPRYPSVGEWTNKLWCIQTMECYSDLKKRQKKKKTVLVSPEKMWRKLKCILLAESSQSEKMTYWMIPIIWQLWKRQNYGDSKKISGARDEGWRDEQVGHRGVLEHWKQTVL